MSLADWSDSDSQSGWWLAFGRNGLLHDSNVVRVLAARGLERNSFPSHSFSWHLSPVYGPPHPRPLSSTSSPATSLTPQNASLKSLPQTVTAKCHMVKDASGTVLVSWRARRAPVPNTASLFSAAPWAQHRCGATHIIYQDWHKP